MWTHETAITYLNKIVSTLRRQDDLSPDNPTVTETLGGLVATLRRWQRDGFGAALVHEPALAEARTQLPRICGLAECQLEKWWCRKVLATTVPARKLSEFWYLPNYLSLRDAETALVSPQALRHVVFLGCGALPLTAILLAQADPNAQLRCLDADAQACTLADDLVCALGLQHRITLEHARAETCNVPEGATVISASLLQAPGLYEHLAASGTTRLLVRDVEGVYCWLYRPAAAPGPIFHQRAKTPPAPERINITRDFTRVPSPEHPGTASMRV